MAFTFFVQFHQMIQFGTIIPSYLLNHWRTIFFRFELCNPTALANCMPERRAVYSAPSFVASSRYSKAGCSNFETRLIPIQKRPSEPQQRFRGFLLILHQSGVPEFSLVWPDKMLLLLLISRNHWNHIFFALLILIMRLHFYLFLHLPIVVVRVTVWHFYVDFVCVIYVVFLLS